jgi:hypothetical protein
MERDSENAFVLLLGFLLRVSTADGDLVGLLDQSKENDLLQNKNATLLPDAIQNGICFPQNLLIGTSMAFSNSLLETDAIWSLGFIAISLKCDNLRQSGYRRQEN